MKKWKKVVTLGMSVVTAVALAACGNGDSNKTPKNDNDFKGQTLKVGVWGGE